MAFYIRNENDTITKAIDSLVSPTPTDTDGRLGRISATTVSGGHSATMAEIRNGLFIYTVTSGAPSSVIALLLPSAADAVAGLSGVTVNDSLTFHVVNNSDNGISITGFPNVEPFTASSRSQATYIIVYTNVSSGTEAYTLYRV